MRFIGIDPGVEPGICVVDEEGNILQNVLIKRGNFKKDSAGFNYVGVKDFFSQLKEDERYVAYIEDVHSVYNSSAKANFNFGGSRFALEMCCVDWDIPVVSIQPKMWQKYMWKTQDIQPNKNGKKGKDTKMTSYNCAKRLLGEGWKDELFLPTKRSKVVNHNMVDAYLLAICALGMTTDSKIKQ
jgi:hypothetical protein